MILNMVGGGGASMNFSVSAFASADALPASASENAIAVITESEITSWIFSATEPESPSSGMVWIATGTSSSVEFNALTDSGLMVYPVAVKQFNGGSWVNRVAKSYQDGVWADWSKDLFNNGAVCEFNTFKESNVTLTMGNEIKISHSGDWGHFWSVWTKEQIDVTPFTKLCMDATFSYVSVGSGLGIGSEVVASSGDITNVKPWVAMVSINASSTHFEVDLSDISGQYYCGVWSQGDISSGATGTITKIWLE